ncbi:MAG TPA: hypothetical protein VGX92_06105 [Pyrinomonadaceae bacterium]|jgi:hypothetical protein|nr:hypothetical protein [Pyrinomonadaceae bacterium]
MKVVRRSLLLLGGLVLLAFGWLWWNRFQKADMAGYVPADTLVYLEANSLPDITTALTSTDAWKALAAPAGIRPGLGELPWWSRLALWTGVGPGEAVIFSRAQVAVAVMGFDSADAGDTLKLKPLYAVVVETHTSQGRTREFVLKRIGDFARRAYGEPRMERRQEDETEFITWSSTTGERRIIAAVVESVAVLGNDEAAVRACLAVRRGERQNLAGDAQLEVMRERVAGHGALAFGFVSATGSARLLEVAAKFYAGQISEDTRVQSALAVLLPQLVNKIPGSAGWSARMTGGIIEDRYHLSLRNGVATRLRDQLALPDRMTLEAASFLPADTYSMTRYEAREPEAAWRGMRGAIASQLDTASAFVVTQVFNSMLKPYGIEEPEIFLRAVGPELVTARLDDTGASTVLVVEVRDEKALREMVARRLGTGSRTERVGDALMMVSADEERGAASFVAGRLIMGAAANVRRCLEARNGNHTLDGPVAFKEAARLAVMNSPASALTYTDEKTPALSFIKTIASQRGASAQPFKEAEFERSLGQIPYAVSATRLVEGGFEKTTRSSFGQFGALVAQFAPETQPGPTP